jgi:hypothetical protein
VFRDRPDFRRAYLANAVSQLGDSFQFVAVMWLAVETGGAFGVIAVRLADGLPALLLGLHGGASADRRDRRRTMIAADLVRGLVLAPIAVAGFTGHLSIWAVAPAGLVVATASSYFVPAFGAALPQLVGREDMQRANGLASATNSSLMVAGRALAAALLIVVSIGSFFAVNAVSFFASAALLARVRLPRPPTDSVPSVSLHEGVDALRTRAGLRIAIAMLALGTAIMTGVWTVGVAELAHGRLGRGAAGLSLLLTATALGTILAGALLARRPLRLPVRRSCAAWALLLPGYVLLGSTGSLPLALLGTFVVGVAAGAPLVLLTTAVQQSIPDELLGRVLGVVFVANVGAKPLGLLLIAPLYGIVGVRAMFVAGGLVAASAALASTLAVAGATTRAREAAPAGSAGR